MNFDGKEPIGNAAAEGIGDGPVGEDLPGKVDAGLGRRLRHRLSPQENGNGEKNQKQSFHMPIGTARRPGNGGSNPAAACNVFKNKRKILRNFSSWVVNGLGSCYTRSCLTGENPRHPTSDPLFSEFSHRMSFTVFLGNLPTWVTADDIQSWLNAEALVADSIKVIRNPETQESKGFAFIEAPNAEEMQSIIRRFDRAPLEDKLLRANPAQPPKGKGGPVRTEGRPQGDARGERRGPRDGRPGGRPAGDRPAGDRPAGDRPVRTDGDKRRGRAATGTSAFAEELAKAL